VAQRPVVLSGKRRQLAFSRNSFHDHSAPDTRPSPLGKTVSYQDQYDASLLFPIARSTKRDEIGVDEQSLPFAGVDIWTGFELSWLNARGKPQVGIATFRIPADSPNLIESKSFKLY
jgi:7-cyano-7-deazaguanine reductase